MSTMSIISTAAIVLFCMYLIIYPYLRRNTHGESKYADNHQNQETIDKKALMVTLNEIEFDYKMHKISEEDFHKLSRQYQSMIARDMHETAHSSDEHTRSKDASLLREIDEEIERELAIQRKLPGGEP